MKQIELTKGQVTLVDDEDYEWLSRWSWYAQLLRGYASGRNYAAARSDYSEGKKRSILMHRAILARVLGRELSRTEQVDHINRDPLDNRRRNLRLASSSENSRNLGIRTSNTSGYKGVSLHRKRGSWRAQIMLNGKQHHLGYFDTPEDAAHAYDKAARELHGEFAVFNF